MNRPGSGWDAPFGCLCRHQHRKTEAVEYSSLASPSFRGFRAGEDGKECFAPLGRIPRDGNTLAYDAPELSVTTFFAESTLDSTPSFSAA